MAQVYEDVTSVLRVQPAARGGVDNGGLVVHHHGHVQSLLGDAVSQSKERLEVIGIDRLAGVRVGDGILPHPLRPIRQIPIDGDPLHRHSDGHRTVVSRHAIRDGQAEKQDAEGQVGSSLRWEHRHLPDVVGCRKGYGVLGLDQGRQVSRSKTRGERPRTACTGCEASLDGRIGVLISI